MGVHLIGVHLTGVHIWEMPVYMYEIYENFDIRFWPLRAYYPRYWGGIY